MEFAIGLLLGLVGALLTGRALSAVLIRVTPTDPATLFGISVLFIGVTAIACFIPARRASRVSPIDAIRVT